MTEVVTDRVSAVTAGGGFASLWAVGLPTRTERIGMPSTLGVMFLKSKKGS